MRQSLYDRIQIRNKHEALSLTENVDLDSYHKFRPLVKEIYDSYISGENDTNNVAHNTSLFSSRANISAKKNMRTITQG